MEQSTLDLRDGGEVRPYKIHVSSKYLDLTKKKLELTRLPHELLVPRAREWEFGTPKSEIEPLVDFWLEHYSWRARENTLNSTLPQYRTAISLPTTPHPIRIHFLHITSPDAHAIPLLLLPSFPLPNLSPLLAPLFHPLTTPSTPTSQTFHLVIPSIPGLGFSDALQSDSHLLAQTAELFNILMTERLGYEFYLASNTDSGRGSPVGIDYHLARLIGENYPNNCLGTHLIEPVVQRPRIGSWAWTKFTIAKFFHANVFGYATEDFHSLRISQSSSFSSRSSNQGSASGSSPPLSPASRSPPRNGKRAGFGIVGTLGLREPNTLSYALCDSPVGLLSLVVSALRRASPHHKLNSEEMVDVAQMAWLPGPEAGLRFWCFAGEEVRVFNAERNRRTRKKARVAVSVFAEGGEGEEGGYVCPAWLKGRFEVVGVQRVDGRAGLVAWERGEVVIEGIRELARGVEDVDGRLKLQGLEAVVVGNAEQEAIHAEQTGDESFVQWDVESPDTDHTVVDASGR